MKQQIELAQQRPLCSGVRPILEIDSPMRADEVELQKALAQDQSLASKFVRLFALKDQPSSLYSKFLFPIPVSTSLTPQTRSLLLQSPPTAR